MKNTIDLSISDTGYLVAYLVLNTAKIEITKLQAKLRLTDC